MIARSHRSRSTNPVEFMNPFGAHRARTPNNEELENNSLRGRMHRRCTVDAIGPFVVSAQISHERKQTCPGLFSCFAFFPATLLSAAAAAAAGGDDDRRSCTLERRLGDDCYHYRDPRSRGPSRCPHTIPSTSCACPHTKRVQAKYVNARSQIVSQSIDRDRKTVREDVGDIE